MLGNFYLCAFRLLLEFFPFPSCLDVLWTFKIDSFYICVDIYLYKFGTHTRNKPKAFGGLGAVSHFKLISKLLKLKLFRCMVWKTKQLLYGFVEWKWHIERYQCVKEKF